MHIEKEYPKEACGLIIKREDSNLIVYKPCTNLAHNNAYFDMSPKDYADAEDMGDILGIVHSHTDTNAKESQADIVSCNKSELPWYIISFPNISFNKIMPTEDRLPLENRQFFHGVIDCYTLIKDYYDWELNIKLPDWPREDDWWSKGKNYYLDRYEASGFIKLPADTKLQKHDLIIMMLHSSVPNHGAIYLGNEIILHHLHNALSSKGVYGGYWKKHTHSILRHKEVIARYGYD